MTQKPTKTPDPRTRIPVEAFYWRGRDSRDMSTWPKPKEKEHLCPCGYPGPEPCNGCPNGCKREGLA